MGYKHPFDWPKRPRTGTQLYDLLHEFVLGGRSKTERYMYDNTSARLQWVGGEEEPNLVVRLHASDIITVRPDGSFTLDWHGWFTQLTNKRMNEMVGGIVSVSGCKRTYLTRRGSKKVYLAGGDATDGTLGVHLGPRGGVTGGAIAEYDCWRDAENAGRREDNAERRRRAAETRRWEKERERQRVRDAAWRDMTDEQRFLVTSYLEMEAHQAAYYKQLGWRQALPSYTDEERRLGVKRLRTNKEGTLVSCYDDSPWEVGEWRREQVISNCQGLNCSEWVSDALGWTGGNVIAVVQYSGGVFEGGSRKLTCDNMRILAWWHLEEATLLSGDSWYTVERIMRERDPNGASDDYQRDDLKEVGVSLDG